MTDDLLKTDIISWLRTNANGNANARPRKFLVAYLLFLGHKLPKADPDRVVRRVCAEMPEVGSSLKGYFYITNAADRKVAQGQLAAPAVAMLERKRQIERSAPQGQMSLPMGGER